MRTTSKKTPAKAPAKTTSATTKTHAHPSWVDMIKVSEMLLMLLLVFFTPFLT